MEHIGTITNPYLQEVTIPCMLSSENEDLWYDDRDFESFPLRQQVDGRTLVEGRLASPPLESNVSFVSFVQSWLWFGLLSSFLGNRHSMATLIEDFARESPTGRRVLDTGKLEYYIQNWRQRLSSEDLKHQSSAVQQIDRILGVANYYVKTFMCRPTQTGTYLDAHPIREHKEVSLAIMCLGFALTWVKKRVWPTSKPYNWNGSELNFDRLTSAGWCPSDITMLERMMSSPGIYFASLLRPRLRCARHGSLCNANQCEAMNVTGETKATYRTDHVVGCDQKCRSLRVSELNLMAVLNQPGQIPVVQHNLGQILNDTLPLSNNLKVDCFVAISHVWIERLGNPFDNALPECQLVRIQHLVDRLTQRKGTHFWIDTLCVPQDEGRPHLTSFRRGAIKSMDQVYRKAEYVLVLDAELQDISVHASLEERVIRLVCCNWIRRLWTLQEAVLGSKIILQLADGTLDLFNQLLRAVQDSQAQRPWTQTILMDLGGFLARMQYLAEDHPLDSRMTRLINACLFRSTSESQDEALCLSIIAELPFPRIVDAQADDRWRMFLVTQRVFPKELFFSAGERMETEGFRWAPRSIIRRPYEVMSHLLGDYGTGEAGDDGFSLVAHGLTFDSPTIAFRHSQPSFWLYLQERKLWIFVLQRQADGQDPSAWRVLMAKLLTVKKLAIILQSDFTRRERGMDTAFGVLVGWNDKPTPASQGSDTIRCCFLATVNTKMETGERELSGLPEIRQRCLEGTMPTGDTWTADTIMLPHDQRWCVT